MKRIERIRNPYQDRINALNAKDMDEELKADAFLKKSHDPIPDDINNTRFPMTDILTPNVLKPEELSMNDLLDQLQIQTILNNNIPAFVKKEIKSEVTQEMIKQFKFDSSKPVEINGVFYKFKPPGLDLKIKDVPPPFPSEAEYKREINALIRQELKTRSGIETQRVILTQNIKRIDADYNRGRISEDEYVVAERQFEELMLKLDEATG